MINRRFAGGPGTKSYHETPTPISEVEVRRVKRTTFARGEPRALGPDRPLVPVDKTNESCCGACVRVWLGSHIPRRVALGNIVTDRIGAISSRVSVATVKTRRDGTCDPKASRAIDHEERQMTDNSTNSRGRSNLWNLLLVVPFVALLWVPFYNSIEPTVWGIPFFYWYQFLWVFITPALIIWVYRQNDERRSR
jgi:Protein of unknown function (DUF3311)